MSKFNYSIRNFNWNKSANTLSANANDLHVSGYYPAFPNGRRQFNIYNEKTGEFRRFRLWGEDKGMGYLFFVSEDGIICEIKIHEDEEMKIKIYIDDERTPVDSTWVIARSFEKFCSLLKLYKFDEIEAISFDHDLGTKPNGDVAKDGYDCAKFLIETAMNNDIVHQLPQLYVHSMNPVGAANIIGYVNSFLRFNEMEESCRWYQIPFTI